MNPIHKSLLRLQPKGLDVEAFGDGAALVARVSHEIFGFQSRRSLRITPCDPIVLLQFAYGDNVDSSEVLSLGSALTRAFQFASSNGGVGNSGVTHNRKSWPGPGPESLVLIERNRVWVIEGSTYFDPVPLDVFQAEYVAAGRSLVLSPSGVMRRRDEGQERYEFIPVFEVL